MTEAEALRELQRISQQYAADPEVAHQLAESVLLHLVPESVRVEYVSLRRKVGFKY